MNNDIEDLKHQINNLIDQWAFPKTLDPKPTEPEKPKRTDGKRAVRTKSTGDRVYVIDTEKKTKAWVTSPEVLQKLDFSLNDVEDIDDSELVSYQMAPSIYRID